MFSKNLTTNILIVVALAAAGYVAYKYLVPCTTCTSSCSSGNCSLPASAEQE